MRPCIKIWSGGGKPRNAHGSLKARTSRKARRGRLLAIAVAAASQAILAPYRGGVAWAGHKAGRAAQSAVTITQNGPDMIIHAGNNSILNLASFDIAQGQSVQIIQPSARSKVLEEVLGSDPTLIDGSLTANGRVYLVNANGIDFGADAQVHVGALTAVAGHYSSADFLAGADHFTNLSGAVTNEGQITASERVALIGTQVSNTGSISAGSGTVVLAAGADVFVGTEGSSIYAQVTPGAASLASNIPGSGDIYSLALGGASRIQARKIVVNGGGGNVKVSGTLDASTNQAGAQGGSVSVTGGNVALSAASVNASGPEGGGTVSIGGGAHGQGGLTAAGTTSISADTTITANALTDGAGGQVVIWSTTATNFAGQIAVTGAGSGAGGWVEVSGGNLTFSGIADRQGPGGDGTLLLDPATITIDAPTAATIKSNLALGPVDEMATSEILVTASFDIHTLPNKLTLDAPLIDLSGAITDVPGQLLGGATVRTVDLHSGGLIQNGIDLLPATGGTMNIDASYVSAEDVSIGKQIALNSLGATTGTAATADSWTVTAPITISGDFAANISGGAAFSFSHAVTLGGNVALVSVHGGDINFASTVDGAFSLEVNSGGTTEEFDGAVGSGVALTSLTVDATGGTTTIGGNVSTTAGQTYGDAVTLSGGAATISLTDATGAITFASTVTGTGTALTAAGAGGNIFDSTVNVKSLKTSGAGGTTILGNVTTTAGQTYSDAVTLTPGAQSFSDATGAITFSSSVSGATTLLTVSGAGGNTLSGAVNVQSLDVTGAHGTTLGGSVTTTAGQTYADAVTLSGGGVSVSDSAGEIIFSTTITGAGTSLSVGAAGGNFFDGAVNVKSLSTSGGTTTLAGGVTTSAGQTYGDAVTLSGAAITVSDTTGAITFTSTVTGAATALTASGAGGNVFDGAVVVKSLHTTGAGGTTLLGNVTTTAGQTYGDAVSLGAGTLSLTDATGAIVFTSSVSGASTNLTVSAAQGNAFDGATNLMSLDVVGAGGTTLGGSVTTSAGQTYGDAVTLSGAATVALSDSGGIILFTSTVSGVNTPLTVAGAGGNVFDSTVNVKSLHVSGAGGTTLLGNVTTTAGQTYSDAVTLTPGAQTFSDATGAITFSSSVSGASTLLTVSGAGGNTLSGAVNVESLNVSGAGGTTLAGSVTTTAGQTYGDAVTLSGSGVTVSDGVGAITFTSSITGASTPLTVSAAGGDFFDGAVNVKSLLATGGAISLGGSVTTSAGQTYVDAVTLSGATLTVSDSGGVIAFDSTLSGVGTAFTSSGAGGNVFDNAVNVKSLHVSGAGGTTLLGNVTTTAGQTYSDAVTLASGPLSLSDATGAITFSSSVSGASTVLTVSGAGGNVFDGATNLQSLNVTGISGTTLAGTVTTSAGQTYGDAVTLSGSGVTLGDTAGEIIFTSTVSGATALSVSGAGGNFFDSTVNVKSLKTSGGTTTLAGNVTTTAGQTYLDAVTLSGGTISVSDATGAITFGSTVTGATTALTAAGAGGNVFDGAVVVKSLGTSGAGGTTLAGNITTTAGQTYGDAVTLSGASITVSDTAGVIMFSSTVSGASTALTVSGAGGDVFDGAVNVQSLNVLGGAITLAGNVTTTAGQTYGEAVTLGGSGDTLSDNAGIILFASTVSGAGTGLSVLGAGGNVFDAAVNVKSLNVGGAGGTMLLGNVTTSAGQTYGDAVTLTPGAQSLTDSGGVITFDSSLSGASTVLTVSGAGGNAFDGAVNVESLNVSGAGGTTLAGSVTTTAGQTYGDAVTLSGAGVTVSDGVGAITFTSSITGASTPLSVSAAGGDFFDGAVNVKSLLATGGAISLGGSVTTSAGQTYVDAVTLSGATLTVSDSGGVIAFNSTVSGAGTAFTASGAGGNVFDSTINVKSLHVTGAGGTTLLGNVTTTAGQTYSDAVTLASGPLSLLDATGAITFSSSVSGASTALTVSGAGGNAFDGVTNLQSLDSIGAGGTTLGGSVTTSAGQTYGDAVTLSGSGVTLGDTAGEIIFTSTVSGATALSVSAAGGNFFDSTVNVKSLKTSGGTTTLAGNVTTTAGQTYLDAVTLSGGMISVIDATGAIAFSSTVTGANTALTAAGAGGNIFDGAVMVKSLNTIGAGGTTLAGNITTTAGQTYGDAVTLSGAAIRVTDTSGVITFSSTVSGASTALTVSGAGGDVFDGAVNVQSLNVLGGAITLAGNVTTTAGQTYGEAVTLSGSGDTLSDNAGIILFASTVAGASTPLTVAGAGGNVFDGSVNVKSLHVSGAGGTSLSGDVTTTAGQTYGDALTLIGATRSLSDLTGAITFASTVSGTSTALTAAGAGGDIFDGSVNVLSLHTTGAGGTTLAANITTTAGQTYGDAVTLGGSSVTVTDGTGEITFTSSISGANTGLTVAGAGGNFLDGAVVVKSLDVTGAGGTTLAGSVTTTAGQTYADALTLSGQAISVADTGSGVITFDSTVSGAATAFTSAGAGGNVFDNSINVKSLAVSGAGGTTLLGNVTTSAGQTYGDAVTLGTGVQTLADSGGQITFDSTLRGPLSLLTVSGAGGNTFDGAVNVESLDVTGAGGTTIGANVSTTAGQTYADAVTLSGGGISLTDDVGAITFDSTVSGAATALFVSAAGGDFFDGTVVVKSLDTAGGTTTLGGDVTTTAGQTYGDAVTLTGASRTLTDSSGMITFDSTVTGAGTALTVSGAGGNVFDGTVMVQALNVLGAGGTTLGSDVSTTAGQTYGDAVTVTGDQTLVDPSGAITFTSTLTGAGTALFVEGAGGNFFDGAVTLKSLDVQGAGGTTIGANVSTTNGQTYEDAVTLTPAVLTLSDSAGVITFDLTVTGPSTALTLSGAGGNVMDGDVNVLSLNTVGGGGTTLGGNVTTSNGQTYQDAVTLISPSQSFTDPNGAITFEQSLTGVTTAVFVDGAAGDFFDGPVDVLSLTTQGAGGTTIASDVTTSAGQTYENLVTLTSPSQTFTDSGGMIKFEDSIRGKNTVLTVDGEGGNVFMGTASLKSLNVGGAGGTTVIGAISTTNGQTYTDAVTLGPAFGLLIDPTTINFEKKIDGTGKVLANDIDTHGQVFTITTIFFTSNTQSNLSEFTDSNFALESGARSLELATVIAGAITFEAPQPVPTPTSLTPSERQDLLLLGIYVKSESDEVILGNPTYGIVIVDWPPIHQPRPEDRKVTPVRLEAQRVKQIVAEVEQVVGPQFANQKQITDLVAAGVADYRAQLKPSDEKVPPAGFAQFVLTHQATPQERLLAEKLLAMRELADNISSLGLSTAEAQGANQYWSSSLTPDDENLVDQNGDYNQHWLLDVLNALPPSGQR